MFVVVATWIRHVAGQADLSAPTGLLTCRAFGSVTPFARTVLDRNGQARVTIRPSPHGVQTIIVNYDGNYDGNAEETPASETIVLSVR